jgi:hypothetical protein
VQLQVYVSDRERRVTQRVQQCVLQIVRNAHQSVLGVVAVWFY